MKKRLFILPVLLVSVLFVITSMISCSSDGTDGVDGAAGPAGPQGPEGPAGPEGPQGGNGSGEVIYSEWMDVTFTADTIHTNQGEVEIVGYYAIIEEPKITAEVLNTADVKMYINMSTPGDPVISPLPYVATGGAIIQMSAYLGKIDLYSNVDAGTVVNNNGQKFYQYRYMIVPGNVNARTSDSQIDWSDYNAVKNHLGLKN